MPFYYLIFLAVIQGITEFLPVSSSAHLVLAPIVTGYEDQGYQIDLAVHFGSLFAVMLFFAQDTKRIFFGGLDCLRLRFRSDNARLFLLISLATIPVIILGAAFAAFDVMDHLRDPRIIAVTMIGFGILLYLADMRHPQIKTAEAWNAKDALIMGLWQAVALIPGTSRSGATVTASRLLDYERRDGAKLSMLMSIPTILAAASLIIVKGAKDNTLTAELGWSALFAAIASFFAALLALSLMMRFLKSVSYTPYVIYRIALGVVLLIVFW